MRAGRDGLADGVEMRLHGLGVGLRHDEGDAGVAARTDGGEHIGVLLALILWVARAGSLLGPLVDEAVLLADPHLVLEPDLNRRFRGEFGHDRRDLRRKVFLNAALVSRSCTGWRGRALMCEKPSFLSARPRLTSDRSTPKRCPRTRFRSTQRQRTTSSLSGFGAASASCFNASFCSSESFDGRPVGLMSIRPSGPYWLKRCAKSRSVCRSMPPIRARSVRFIT